MATPELDVRREIPLPRYTLAIYGALWTAFPKEIIRLNQGEVLTKLARLVPVMVAGNDYCDIGLQARKRRQQGSSQLQFGRLFDLEQQLWRQLGTKREEFIGRGEDKQVVDGFINDCICTALSREEVGSDKLQSFLEVENAVFEAVSVTAVLPGLMKSVGFDSSTNCRNWQDLRNKYRPYANRIPDSGTEASLIGLHAIAMVLKVDDDKAGWPIDHLLGVPTFFTLASNQAREQGKSIVSILDKIKRDYFDLAALSGFSRRGAQVICEAQERIGSFFSRQTLNGAVPQESGKETKLREKLYYSGLLTECFR